MKTASNINGGNPKGERHGSDFYPTPPEPVVSLLNHLALEKGTKIWEPACGEGDISKVLLDWGYDVISSDLREDSGYGIGGVNFLSAESKDCDWIITNPPFNLAEEFIRKAWDCGVSFALLLKIQYFNAAKRIKLFHDCQPTQILPLTYRVDWLFKNPEKHNSPPMDMMWVVWGNHHPLFTDYQPLAKIQEEK